MKKTNVMKKKLTLAVAVFATAMGIMACGKSVDENTANQELTIAVEQTVNEATTTEVVSEPVSTEAANEEVYPLTIVDSNGDSIVIEKEPERVISVAPNLTEAMYVIGAQDKLVGRSNYCDYPAEVMDVESVGSISKPDMEKIISLNPDVVIVSTHFDEENTKKLEELKIPVVTLYEDKDLTGVYGMIETLGKVVNRVDEASAAVKEMQDIIAEVEEKVAGLEAPSVYYVVGYGEYGDYTAGGDTFVGGMLTLAGGDNIAKDVQGWSITLEEIVAADPEIIIIPSYAQGDFETQPNYCELTAVKEGKVFAIDNNMLDRQGYRNAEGIETLAQIFHPEAFK